MLIMTTKVDKRKLLIAAVAVVAAIALLAALGGGDSAPTASVSTAPAADTNDARVKFLTDLGWEVTPSPTESGEIRIPKAGDQVFDRYNELQKKQGLDLSKYTGKRVTRYTYLVTNYNADGEVYVNLFVYRNKIVAADVSSADPTGFVTPLLLVEPDSLK